MNYEITSQTLRGKRKGYAFKGFTHDFLRLFHALSFRIGTYQKNTLFKGHLLSDAT